MRKGVSNEKGKYVESLTARLMSALDFVLADDISEGDWVVAHKRVHDIIWEEYVERKDRK